LLDVCACRGPILNENARPCQSLVTVANEEWGEGRGFAKLYAALRASCSAPIKA
jgi:hypothetical protein